jgi:6-phosphogluconolactonase
MPGEATDRDEAARAYERTIRDRVSPDGDGVPALDVVVLGVGEDGHTASLFPGDSAVDVTDRLVVAIPANGAREARLTLTAVPIEHARHVFVVAVGGAKRAALESVWASTGDLHRTPARIIRACRGTITWIIDRVAGGLTE